MPNHITNRIELKGSKNDLKAMFEKFNTHHKSELRKSHDGSVVCEHKSEKYNIGWFNTKTGIFKRRNEPDVIGLPDEYEFEITPSVDIFPDFKKVIPPPEHDPAYNDLPNQEEAYKSPNWWYKWNVENWGSKWGGYSYRKIDDNVFQFETAWSGCPLIIEAISKAFPEVEIIYEYADEDFGYNAGRMNFKDGFLTEEIPKGGTKEAYDIAFKVMPERLSDFELIDGKYKYKDSE